MNNSIIKIDEYSNQAKQFLNDTGSTLDIEYMETRPYFKDDKEKRDVYRFTIKNQHGYYSAEYGDSTHNTKLHAIKKTGPQGWKAPRPYDILACIGSYYPDNYSDFADEFGYSRDSLSALDIFHACQKEQTGLADIFDEAQLEQLAEIQ